MSNYTTGEMARLCDVTVRTVQYYDTRKILVPSSLSDGGRRLYSEDDLKRLKIICFLRNIGLSIDNIGRILAEENSNNVISVLLEEQAQVLQSELDTCKAKLHAVEQLAQELKSQPSFSVETIHDIAFRMKNKNALRRVHQTMVLVGLFMDAILIVSLYFGIAKGLWAPAFIGFPVIILCGIWVTRLYYTKTAYICPQCHAVFKPGIKEFLFSLHTAKAKKLTCQACGYKGYCIETYGTNN